MTRNRVALIACVAVGFLAALWYLAGPEWAGATTLAGVTAMGARQRRARRSARTTVKDARRRDGAERKAVQAAQEDADAAARPLTPPVGSSARRDAVRAASEDIERGSV